MSEIKYVLLEENSRHRLHEFEEDPWATGVILGEAFEYLEKTHDKKVSTYKRLDRENVIFIFEDKSSVKLIVEEDKKDETDETI